MLLGYDLVTGQLGLWTQDRIRKIMAEALGRGVGLLFVPLTLKKLY